MVDCDGLGEIYERIKRELQDLRDEQNAGPARERADQIAKEVRVKSEQLRATADQPKRECPDKWKSFTPTKDRDP